jgi:hypothetical protein
MKDLLAFIGQHPVITTVIILVVCRCVSDLILSIRGIKPDPWIDLTIGNDDP